MLRGEITGPPYTCPLCEPERSFKGQPTALEEHFQNHYHYTGLIVKQKVTEATIEKNKEKNKTKTQKKSKKHMYFQTLVLLLYAQPVDTMVARRRKP